MAILEALTYCREMALKYTVKIDEVIEAVNYLKHYGYLVKQGNITVNEILEAVKEFQRMSGLKVVDGEVGPKTLRMMAYPRCGISDKKARFVREELNKWGKNELTYFIKDRDTDLPAQIWDNIIAKSFNSWAQVANISFQKVSIERDANLVLGAGDSSRESFGSIGGVLAWAYLPPTDNFNGQLLCKFDKAETWLNSNDNGNGIYLENVACHEFGHCAIGARHLSQPNQLMNPIYNPNIRTPQQYDVKEAIDRYGPPVISPTPEPEPPINGSLQINVEGTISKVAIPGYRVEKLDKMN